MKPCKPTLLFSVLLTIINSSYGESYDPCCSFPCKNIGVCTALEDDKYECDCTGTGYYGDQCQTPYISTRVKRSLKPSKQFLFYFLTHYDWFWDIINSLLSVRKFLMKTVLFVKIGPIAEPSPHVGYDSYTTWNTYTNKSVYARTLPPVPENCPTPMGVKGPKVLPDPLIVAKKLFARDKFEPCSARTNVLFPLFAQHFTHQFFKTKFPAGMPHQDGNHGVDLSHVYGDSIERTTGLRMLKDGKLKYSVIGGEMFPPLVSEADVHMYGAKKVPEGYRFATGHSAFLVSPTFMIFGTLWLREHNRVCDVLNEMHPNWDDERLFQTARLIVTGEMIKVVVEDYVQHMSGFNFKLLYDPELLHGMSFSYHNQVHIEFQLLYRWHSLVPDYFKIDGDDVSVRSLLFNHSAFVDRGMETLMRSFSKQLAGKVQGGRNQGRDTIAVLIQGIKDGRKMRMQSFNQYRVKFGMAPIKSFDEFTNDVAMARDLKEMYGDIDALEFVVGIYLQKPRPHGMFGESMAETGAPYSLKGLYGNPIGSPGWWKPSTFGGQKGFDIIKTSSLQALVCRNVKGCPRVSFKVPDEAEYDASKTKPKPQNESNMADILMEAIRGEKIQSLGGAQDPSVTSHGIGSKTKVSQVAKNEEIKKPDKTEL
uniref:prostaglandin-endoperoxide synthase n=1 Tax=Phallusia mammillata TaxID=59560 RepID=A0A6F9DPA4_9ASCI|nr:prostaglandin G/H synthase 2-like [Phallusia mammillata]